MLSSDAPAHDLATRLRVATRAAHRRAEQAGIMADLLGGHLDYERYRLLVAHLHAIYAELEAGLIKYLHHPLLQAFNLEPLFRQGALSQDMQAMDLPPIAPVMAGPAQALCARIARLSSEGNVARLLAHAYVRYLGDLHGGQVLRRLIAKAYRERVTGALHFYEFGDERAVARAIARFRAGLASVPSDAHGEVLDEALSAFEDYRQLFESLALPPRPGTSFSACEPAPPLAPVTSR